MASPATFLFPLKVALIATGAVSIAMAVKFSVPLIMGFCLYDVPVLWTSFQMWLKPPYLYFIINGIIIIIAATSRFSNQTQYQNHHPVNVPATGQPPVQLIAIRTPPPSDMVAAVVLSDESAPAAVEVYQGDDDDDDEEDKSEAQVVEVRPVVVNGIQQLELEPVDYDENVANYDAWIVPNADFIPPLVDETQLEFFPPVKEKPLVLPSFNRYYSKPATINPPEGGRAVRVVGRRRKSKTQADEQHDTMENTWKMITQQGRHAPPLKTGQLKRSETWNENHGRGLVVSSLGEQDLLDDLLPPPPPPPRRQVSKSATFTDRTNYYDGLKTVAPPQPGGKIRKEPSLSQEELNRRAEEFIKKFNEEMRLQRQESLNNYMEMINRGAN